MYDGAAMIPTVNSTFSMFSYAAQSHVTLLHPVCACVLQLALASSSLQYYLAA